MPLMNPPNLDDLPATPDRADRNTFASRCTALFDQLKNSSIGQWRAAMAWMNAALAEAATSATQAAGSALQSAASAQASAQALAAAQAVSGATRWAPGAYPAGVVVWSPTNGQNYRARTALAASATDPAADPANWFALLLQQSLPVVALTQAGPMQASANVHYLLIVGGIQLLMPATPQPGDLVGLTNASGVQTNTADPNGKSFMGDPSVLKIDSLTASAILKFTTSQGWIKQ